MVITPDELCNQGCFLEVLDRAMTDDFFCNRLDRMIDSRHPLAVLTNRMDRCHLKGSQGDVMHAVLCAVGYNVGVAKPLRPA